jgi:hypothetical protein
MPRPGIPDRDRPPRLFPLPRRGGHNFDVDIAMTSAQRKALEMLRIADCPGIVTTGVSAMYDGEPWIHWRTAYVVRLGVVTIAEYDEDDGYEIHLFEERLS